jgi:hypothetical protein
VTEGILQNSNTVILLTGRGGGNFISMLPQDFEIAVGDVVVAPGKEGYSIARVATIRSDPADSFKGVLLVSVTNIQEARFVDVVVSLK